MAAKTSSAVKNKYNTKAYDRPAITVPKGRLADMQEYAKANGGTVNSVTNELWRGALGMTETEWGYKEKGAKDVEMLDDKA